MADEPIAASSPATAPVETPQENTDMETWSDEQRSEWLKTGDVPKAEAAPKESSEPSPADKAAAEAKTAPDSEPGKQQEPKPAPGEKRKGQLANEIQQLLKKRVEIRQALERELAEKARSTTAQPAEQTQPATLTEPKAEDFDNWDDFRKAERIYQKAETQRLIEEAILSDRRERETTVQAAAVEKQNQQIESDWSKRTREFKASHPEAKDFEPAVQAMVRSELIPPNSFLDQWILYSDHGPALAWHFSQDANEILRIGELHPIAAARELSRLENSFETKPTKVPIPQQPTATSKPPVVVSGKGSAPADEVEAAIESGNTRAYIDAMNRRELAARNG